MSNSVLVYYRTVQATLLAHLHDRAVLGYGRPQAGDFVPGGVSHQVRLHIAGSEDLDEALRSGIVGFRLPGLVGPGLVALRLRPGSGSGIDTVATAALALAQSMAVAGLAATALTDGADGLYLLALGVGPIDGLVEADTVGLAGRYATALAAAAPEIATTDRADSAGRALLQPLTTEPAGLPAPYSLVWHPGQRDDPGVMVPLTLDEVAAASAGMPLDIEPAEVAGRIDHHGDLAAALGRATAGSA